ncbi:MAG TPA: GNAT family N-acetyltransferase [Rhodothermales bacterium]|nr:GNAT family N-acetyltransferase [Rhodothermales bacterium]
MLIRRAHIDDADALTALAHAAKSHWGYPPRWIEIWKDDLTFTPDFIRAHPVFVATERDTILGCYALMLDGDKGIVEHFWVHPSAMGKGLGRTLFDHASTQAAAHGATWLEIDTDPQAEGFYLHLGARRIGEYVYQLEGQPRVLPRLAVDL